MSRTGSRVARGVVGSSLAFLLSIGSSASAADEWRVVGTPFLNSSIAGLAEVAAVSNADVWAVGSYFDGSRSIDRTLIEHWDGSRWSRVPHPAAGTGYHRFTAISAGGPSSVLAVGSGSAERFASEQPLIARWNGSSWKLLDAPTFLNWGAFIDVSIAGTGGWAIGNAYLGTFIARIERGSSRLVPSPNVGWLNGVDTRAGNDAWAVGQRPALPGDPEGTVYRTLIEHWDGNQWAVVDSPTPAIDFGVLEAVDATSGSDAWAVGWSREAVGPRRPLILRWDGGSWTEVALPDVGTLDTALMDVVAISESEAWAVGSMGDRTLILRWDGSTWTRADSPSPGDPSALAGISASTGGDLWGVGSHDNGMRLAPLTILNEQG